MAAKHGLWVVEDAAQAMGAHYKGKKIGSDPRSVMSVYSFHPNKNMTTGEGGAIAFFDDAHLPRIQRLRFHGIEKDAWKRQSKEGSVHIDVAEPARKANFMDLQAAIGLHQIKQLDGFNARRGVLFRRYLELMKDVEEVMLPWEGDADHGHCFHLFVARIRPEKAGLTRDEFVQALKDENIGTGIHYRPAHCPLLLPGFLYEPASPRHAEGRPAQQRMERRAAVQPAVVARTDGGGPGPGGGDDQARDREGAGKGRRLTICNSRGTGMEWPEIKKTEIKPSEWTGQLDSQRALSALCREVGRWSRVFANQLMPDEGLPIEEALHWACFSRLARGLHRIHRDIGNLDSEGVLINCRLSCEDAQNCILLGQPGRKHEFHIEGYELDRDIRKYLHEKSKTTVLDEQERNVLDALNALWIERNLPEEKPERTGEFKRLCAVEREAKSAYRPFKWSSQAVHGTSRWLEHYDLVQSEVPTKPGDIELFHLRQEDPDLDLVLPIYTLNRGFAAIEVLANSISDLPKEVLLDLEDLRNRISMLTSWAQANLGPPDSGSNSN
ncbi:MAG: DegT/DnrJ/EryC1/StrS family aminotransferase [Holophagaceae bacterium]|nr:DegT/DnrJ/EryC1/StrS family aminotransferase [Holophagaceae bacterium]